MQEEVENRTVNLAISTTKLTGRTIIAGIRKYLQHREKVKMKKARDPAVHGKQSVKQLLGQNQGATNVEIDKESIRDMLNQASDDRSILAQRLNISPHQLSYVTNSGEGEGLLFYGNVILPFIDRFPTDLELYRIMTTKLNEVAQEKEA